MPKVESLCDNYTPRGVFKFFLLLGSLLKDYKVFTMVCTITSTFYFFKASYSHMILLQVLMTIIKTKLLNANYEPKVPISTPYVFEGKKCMNSQPHSFTSIPHVFPMYQTNHHVSCITFHPSINRLYII